MGCRYRRGVAVAEFVGVNLAPERGVTRWGTGLYEFWTAADEKVYLHDTNLRSFEYFPSPVPSSLRLVFEYDSDWTPPELAGRPFVVFNFEHVSDLGCEEDGESREAVTHGGDASEAAGQVSLFDWNGEDFFCLESFLLRVTFRARRVTVQTAATGDR